MDNATLKSLVDEYLIYNPDTGVFTYKKSNTRRKVGDLVGSLRSDGYYEVTLKNHRYRLHRLAWFIVYGYMPTKQLDHINGIRHDNRLANLREVSASENQQNLKLASKRNSLGVLGVYFYKGKYCAQIKLDGKSMYLGRFPTLEEASTAYINAKRLLHSHNTI